MNKPRLDIEGESSRFISLFEIRGRYFAAKKRFYTKRKLYSICKANCKFGGAWPNKTRNAKIEADKAAISCRHLQLLKQHLETKAATTTI